MLELIGASISSRVYKAKQIDLDRDVAIKMISADVLNNSDMQERFQREAQALCRLQHPNIVSVYYMAISENGIPYIVMELVSGITLKAEINSKGPMTIERAGRVMLQCCRALQYCHDAQIVHRDIKSQNIVIAQEPDQDSVKIIDFGLSKMTAARNSDTQTGILIGSVEYMSPEQCAGQRATHLSDIYSLGICFYELLSGTLPFEADNPIGLMYKAANSPLPHLSLLEKERETNRILQKATAKSPDKRYQSMLELAEDISDLLSAESESVKSRSNKFNLMAWSAGSLLLLAISTALWTTHQREHNEILDSAKSVKSAKYPRQQEQSATANQPETMKTKAMELDRLLEIIARENQLSSQSNDMEQREHAQKSMETALKALPLSETNNEPTILTGRLCSLIATYSDRLWDFKDEAEVKELVSQAWTYSNKALIIFDSKPALPFAPDKIKVSEQALPPEELCRSLAHKTLSDVYCVASKNHGSLEQAIKNYELAAQGLGIVTNGQKLTQGLLVHLAEKSDSEGQKKQTKVLKDRAKQGMEQILAFPIETFQITDVLLCFETAACLQSAGRNQEALSLCKKGLLQAERMGYTDSKFYQDLKQLRQKLKGAKNG